MNKSIFGLLSLLLLLIIVCIYQKSETLYTLSHPIETQKTPISQEVEVVAKEENTSIKKALEATKVTSIQTTTVVQKTEDKNETFTLLEDIKDSVSAFLSTSKEKYITPVQSEEIISKTVAQLDDNTKSPILASDKEQEEIVAYILSVFKERDKVLEHRDEVMKALDETIEKALYNRRIAIENMNNIFIEIENTQTRLIQERDQASQINPNQEKGQ